MMNAATNTLQKHSVARQILIRVLGAYVAFALLLITIDAIVQYRSVKQEVTDELRTIHESFGPGLAQALWDINTEQVKSSFQGLTNLPSVVGAIIVDDAGSTVSIGGIVRNDGGDVVQLDDEGNEQNAQNLTDVFSHGGPLFYGENDDRQSVGELTVFSSSAVVWQRLRLGIILTAVGVVLSAAALGLIFYFVFSRLLGHPLRILTSAVESIDLDRIEGFQVDVGGTVQNELKVLEESFNRMSANLGHEKAELNNYRSTLEDQVAERTEELERLTGLSKGVAADESSLSALAGQLQGKQTVTEVAEHALDNITEFIGAPSGALYVVGDDTLLHRKAANALSADADEIEHFAPGVGSVGQAARSRQIAVQEHPQGANGLTFGIGTTSSPYIVTTPLVSSDELSGVLELLLLEKITDEQLHWLEKACGITATALRFAIEASEREEAEAALRESERQMSQIIDFLPDAAVVIDTEGRVVFWNRKMETLTGFKAEDMVGKGDHEYAIPFYGDRRPILVDLALLPEESTEAYQNVSRQGDTLSGEIVTPNIATEDGGAAYLMGVATPLYDSEGVAIGAIECIIDITDRKRAEDELHEAKEQAEHAAKTKADFLANMSHEIRTPMNAIIGMAHLALRTELDPKQADYISKIQSSGQHLLGIINDILDFSKIEAGKMDIEVADFDLQKAMDNVANLIGDKASAAGLEFLIDIDPELPRDLRGDSLRLGQVLINYANNAVKFTDEGEITIRAKVIEKSDTDLVARFEVQDTGIGLTPKQKSRLFQSFQQADATTTRKYGGTGLGLAISKQLVELMGGEVGVESEQGEGSTFWFTARLGIGEPLERILTPAPDLRNKRVLVADDNDHACEIISEMLASMTFRVDTVPSGEKALSAISEADTIGDPYEIAFIDWQMPPGIDGMETARRMLATKLDRVPHPVMVTAHGREEVFREAEEAGIEVTLIKPVNPSILFEAAIRALGGDLRSTEKQSSRETVTTADLSALKGARILLAEDNALNQQIATELLTEAGCIVEVAENGRIAVEKVETESYDLVLMDMQMPEMDGVTATEEIRKTGRFSDLPIVAMTANVMEEDRERTRAAGMNDHIGKPVDPDELFEKLTRWIAAKSDPDLEEGGRKF